MWSTPISSRISISALCMNDTPGEAVRLPPVARLPPAREVGSVLVVHGVEVGERLGQPVGPYLRHHQLELRMPVEHPAQHQLPHRLAVLEVGEEPLAEDALREGRDEVRVVATFGIDLRARGRDLVEGVALGQAVAAVHDHRHARARRSAPRTGPSTRRRAPAFRRSPRSRARRNRRSRGRRSSRSRRSLRRGLARCRWHRRGGSDPRARRRCRTPIGCGPARPHRRGRRGRSRSSR